MATYILAVMAAFFIVITLYLLHKIHQTNISIKEDNKKIIELENLTSRLIEKQELKTDKKAGYKATLIIFISLSVWVFLLIFTIKG